MKLLDDIACNLKWIEFKYTEWTSNSIEENGDAIWCKNYENAHVNLVFYIHVSGLVKGTK